MNSFPTWHPGFFERQDASDDADFYAAPSHLSRRPEGGLVLLGMNAAELAANPMAERHVLREVARVLRPGGVVVVTFSNRCSPTKAIRGWLLTDDAQHLAIVRAYLEQATGFGPVSAQRRTADEWHGDPLFGVWARRLASPLPDHTRAAVEA